MYKLPFHLKLKDRSTHCVKIIFPKPNKDTAAYTSRSSGGTINGKCVSYLSGKCVGDISGKCVGSIAGSCGMAPAPGGSIGVVWSDAVGICSGVARKKVTTHITILCLNLMHYFIVIHYFMVIH